MTENSEIGKDIGQKINEKCKTDAAAAWGLISELSEDEKASLRNYSLEHLSDAIFQKIYYSKLKLFRVSSDERKEATQQSLEDPKMIVEKYAKDLAIIIAQDLLEKK